MAMQNTMNRLVQIYSPMTGFCCSDEISLVFGPQKNEDGTFKEIMHQGRVTKIASLMAGKCSAIFLLEMQNFPELVSYVEEMIPCFDARVISLPFEIEACNNLVWRSQYDCKRNTIASYGRFILKKVDDMNGDMMIEQMKVQKNFDFWTRVPEKEIYGIFAKKRITPPLNRKVIENFTWIIKANEEDATKLFSPFLDAK